LSAQETDWGVLARLFRKKMQASRWCNQVRRSGLVFMLGPLVFSGWGQSLLDPEDRLPSADLAVLDSDQVNRALSCQVQPLKPHLGFDDAFAHHHHDLGETRLEASSESGFISSGTRASDKTWSRTVHHGVVAK
jgi:hypothetical protein